jgi:hypothetical protein
LQKPFSEDSLLGAISESLVEVKTKKG